jgi:hypothetical protein
MSPGFDVSSEIAAAIGDRAGVWRFIRDFAGQWLSPLAEDDGWSEADIISAEKRLRVRFPAALREAYGLFGRREDLTSNQDRLLRPGQLCLSGSGQVLIFRWENQGCAQWGVRLDQPGHPDPPVVWEGLGASGGTG